MMPTRQHIQEKKPNNVYSCENDTKFGSAVDYKQKYTSRNIFSQMRSKDDYGPQEYDYSTPLMTMQNKPRAIHDSFNVQEKFECVDKHVIAEANMTVRQLSEFLANENLKSKNAMNVHLDNPKFKENSRIEDRVSLMKMKVSERDKANEKESREDNVQLEILHKIKNLEKRFDQHTTQSTLQSEGLLHQKSVINQKSSDIESIVRAIKSDKDNLKQLTSFTDNIDKRMELIEKNELKESHKINTQAEIRDIKNEMKEVSGNVEFLLRAKKDEQHILNCQANDIEEIGVVVSKHRNALDCLNDGLKYAYKDRSEDIKSLKQNLEMQLDLKVNKPQMTNIQQTKNFMQRSEIQDRLNVIMQRDNRKKP